MQYDNDAKQMKYEVLKRVCELAFEGTLEEHLDSIPYEIIPGNVAKFRCCVYKEREIIRERVSVALGKKPPAQENAGLVTVLPAACEGCPSTASPSRPTASGAWQKNAWPPAPLGRSRSPAGGRTSTRPNARNAAAAPPPALTMLFRTPCAPVCVPALWTPSLWMQTSRRSSSTTAASAAVHARPIAPSAPFRTPPRWSTSSGRSRENKEVFAIFAPAIEGQFGEASVGSLKQALRNLGFDGVYEVALGADAVARHEAQDLKRAVENGSKLTTSCCPAFVTMIEKHFPRLLPMCPARYPR